MAIYAKMDLYSRSLVILLCFGQVLALSGSDFTATVQPDQRTEIIENQEIFFRGSIQTKDSTLTEIFIQIKDLEIARVVGNSSITLETTACSGGWIAQNTTSTLQTACFNFTFVLRGLFLGRTNVVFYKGNTVNDALVLPVNHRVTVIRKPSVLSDILTYMLAAFMAITTIGYGCTIDLQEVKTILKKPIPPLVGLFCQFIINPLVSFAVGKVYSLPPALALGLFAFGCCPGGGNSNLWTLVLGGDVNLSIIMTLLSIFASFATLPIWMFTLGRTLVSEDIDIPFVNIFIALVLLVAPCILGILINRCLPKLSKVMCKLIKPVAIFVILLFLTVGVYSKLYIFRLMGKWKVVLSGLTIPCAVYPISAFIAWLCRQPRDRILTICIETAVQNAGTGLLIILTTFPQPDADIAAVMPLMAVIFSAVPLLLLLIAKTIKRKCCKTDNTGTDSDCEKNKTATSNSHCPKVASVSTVSKDENM